MAHQPFFRPAAACARYIGSPIGTGFGTPACVRELKFVHRGPVIGYPRRPSRLTATLRCWTRPFDVRSVLVVVVPPAPKAIVPGTAAKAREFMMLTF